MLETGMEIPRRPVPKLLVPALLGVLLTASACLRTPAQNVKLQRLTNGFRCQRAADTVEVTAIASRVVRVDVRSGGVTDERTPVLDSAFHGTTPGRLRLSSGHADGQIATEAMRIRLDCAAQTLMVSDGTGNSLVSASSLSSGAAQKTLVLRRVSEDPIYGIAGIPRFAVETSVERPQGAKVKAGAQGDGGAPFFFTKNFGLLVDSVDGEFVVSGADVIFKRSSRAELEFYVLVGPPLDTMAGLADLTGQPPMPPRWTLGFLNSQWGIDETELKTLVAHYRSSHIPLDAFILDYDWKAWGEDHYGEWRWNSTSGAGNEHSDKFPDGADGTLSRQMLAQGVHLAGILKPRILLYKEGTTDFLEAAAYADAHHFWYPGLAATPDQKTGRPTKNLDFSKPEERAWFWKHLEPSFRAGITGWWNDEADELPDETPVPTSSLEFFNMGRALYEGQRSASNTRVWSLNRNFYLGSQRFGYAEWSGDIHTGAASMASQPPRMLATLDLGEPHWSMDTGGFRGDPTSEEYARWMEFAAFTPVDRVHAGNNHKRQPWIFGPIAEAAATEAIRLRYSLMPYIYSAERHCYETGIGLVRPLEWIFPDDPDAARRVDEWMFGDALLVAPVLDLKAETRKVYLPAGSWTNYSTGKVFAGGRTIEVNVDSKTWADIPLFIRENSVLATEAPGDDTDAMRPSEITLDIYPSQSGMSTWTMYDDDGATYDYERGGYFKQSIRAGFATGEFGIDLSAPEGKFATSLRSYLVRIHSVTASALRWNGQSIRSASTLGAAGVRPSWTSSQDRFGNVVELRVNAGVSTRLNLSAAFTGREAETQ